MSENTIINLTILAYMTGIILAAFAAVAVYVEVSDAIKKRKGKNEHNSRTCD